MTKPVLNRLDLSWWNFRQGDLQVREIPWGQVGASKSHQATSRQGQPQLWFYRAFDKDRTVPAWPVVRDRVHVS